MAGAAAAVATPVDDTIERCLLVKQEVFVYNIPPRQSARGYRAADWNLAAPNWTGRMRCVARGSKLEIRLEDRGNGELFAACPVQVYPGMSVEPVTDSSRYFVICVQDAGRKAFIGMGFADRSDSFDLNVTLQDHFKYLKKESELVKEQVDPVPKLDLAFKAGQTIRINIPNKKGDGEEVGDKPASGGNNGRLNRGVSLGGALPPPPGGRILPPPPPGAGNLTPLQSPSEAKPPPVIGSSSAAAASSSSNVDLLGDLMAPAPTLPAAPAGVPRQNTMPATTTTTTSAFSSAGADDPWGDFESASGAKSSGNWETF